MNKPSDYFSNPAAFKREIQGIYKEIFSGVIKESFLIEILDLVQTNPKFGAVFFAINNVEKMLSIDSVVTGKDCSSLDICKMIAMNHYANTVQLDDYERGKLQKNKSYMNQLAYDVIKMYSIEKLVIPTFSNSSLEPFLPLIYYITALTHYCGAKHDDFLAQKTPVKSPYNSDFNYRMIYKIIMKIKACISLADIRATDELTVIYRSLIELFMTYAALWDQNKGVITSYYKFDQAAFNYNYGNEIPDDIKLMAKDMGVNDVKFVNYGWIKNLELFQKMPNKSKSINVSGLAKLLDKKYGNIHPTFGSDLYTFYRACNPQTHGTMLVMNYFQLELHIFQNIALMLKFLCAIMSEHLFDFDFKCCDLDLFDELNNALEKSKKVFDWLNKDEKNLAKTNNEYQKRIFCSIKMNN